MMANDVLIQFIQAFQLPTVHLLSAFMHGQRVTIAQKEIAEKTNEIPELRRLLQDVDIEGKVVTADTLPSALTGALPCRVT